MRTNASDRQFLPSGLYAWIVTAYFGAVLLDVVYARLAARDFEPSQMEAMFSGVADLLLVLGGLTVFAGIVAIGSAWSAAAARNLFSASLFFVLAEFLAPVLFTALLQGPPIDPGLTVGMWIRLTASGLSSLLAFLGLWKLSSSSS